MKLISQIGIGLKALSQLGPTQVGLYGLYQLGLRSGHYQRQLSATLSRLNTINSNNQLSLHPCLPNLPKPDDVLKLIGDRVAQLYDQADKIVDGLVRLFGDQPVPLVLSLPGPLEDWTSYGRGSDRINDQDIKFIWEPGRFGWACTLAMAYHLSKQERYAEAFWRYTDRFFTSNPPYQGPHWSSAQEVAIRLVALAFALQVFSQSNLATENQLKSLANVITFHAERIPPTLVYARSQNNNHLISEALGLYTASALLPEYPLADKWRNLGWHWLMVALLNQIDPDGTYTQHSTNYHRLMLQAALWACAINQKSVKPETIPPAVIRRLNMSTVWLYKIMDQQTGQVPNLGHNDGAYILPLTVCPYKDYRPVIYAAMRTFQQDDFMPDGLWEDMSLWLGIPPRSSQVEYNDNRHKVLEEHSLPSKPPHVLVNQANDSWAVLHVAHFHSRPAHADQLHLDLWWHGLNLTLDPGTYLYNSPSPWENSLSNALVHNTVTVDGQEFMQRAGRFLYLDWAQAKVLNSQYIPGTESQCLTASHNGYRKLGITHTRTVTTFLDGHWEVEDCLIGLRNKQHVIRLHWLLPDWEYEVRNNSQDTDDRSCGVTLRSPRCKLTLRTGIFPHQDEVHKNTTSNFQLARSGELLAGSGTVPTIAGYYSPTYGVKIPALAYIHSVEGYLPITLKSQFILPRARAAVILIQDGRIALVERQRPGRHYFVIPGGKIEPDETPAMAAVREAKEELGLEVNIGRLVANVWFQGQSQYYFLAEVTGGSFEQVSRPETNRLPDSQKGTYHPIWLPLDDLPSQPVVPQIIAELVSKSHKTSWPANPMLVHEPAPDELV